MLALKPALELWTCSVKSLSAFVINLMNGIMCDMELKQNKFLPAEKQVVTANPDVNAVELRDDDEFIVLACDGIWDCMSSQQLVDFIREQLTSESKLSAVCEKVLDRCLAPSTAGGEGCDNMTMILVQFKKLTPSSTTSSVDKSSASEDVQAVPKPAESSES